MRVKWRFVGLAAIACITAGMVWALVLARSARAHCDTLAGPVAKDARRALAKRDVSPALKWVKPKYEEEVKAAFRKALVGREQDVRAGSRSETQFLGTLVRLHRASEGEPFTGLKPADQVEPIIAASDRALEQGSVDKLVRMVTADVEAGIRKRFATASQRRKRADVSVQDGRRYVEAYVDYVHYVEQLHGAAEAKGRHHDEEVRHGAVSNGGNKVAARRTTLGH